MRAHMEGNITASVDEITPFYQMAMDYVRIPRAVYLSTDGSFGKQIENIDSDLRENNFTDMPVSKLRLVEGDNEDYQNYQKLCRGENIPVEVSLVQ